FYAVWTIFAWPLPGAIFFALALAWSVYLVVTARRLQRRTRALAQEPNETEARIAKGMTILANAQGGLIFAASVVLGLLGQWIWLLPVIALIVALHFFPMAPMFGRSIDYYLGAVMAIAGLTGLTLAGLGYEQQVVWAVTGVGGALVTSAYGLFMVRTARRQIARSDHDPETACSVSDHTAAEPRGVRYQ